MTVEPAGPDVGADATTGAAVLRHGLWNTLSLTLPQAYLLVMSIVAARFLGPDDMGRQSFIAFVVVAVTMLFSGGMSVSLMRHIGESLGAGQAAAVRGLIAWAWRIEIAAAVVGGGALGVVTLTGAEPQAAWALAAVACAFGIVQTIPSAVLTGTRLWREATIVGLVTGGIAVPATIAVLAAGGGIVGMFAVEVVVTAANLAWASILALRRSASLAPASTTDRDLCWQTIRNAGWLTIGTVLTMIIFRRSEFFFLEHYSTDSEIAMYSIAFAAIYGIALIPESLTAVMLPAFATLYGAGSHDRMQAGFSRALRLLVLLTLPLAAATLAVGPEAIRFAYGSEYEAAGTVLQVMAVGLPLLTLMSVSQAFLLGLGKVRSLLPIDACAAAVNIALAFILIPRHDAVGAALANLGAQGTIAVITLVYALVLVRGVSLDLRSMGAAALASALGGGAAWLVVDALGGIVGIVLGLMAGAAVFAATAVTVKVLRPDDAHWIGETAGDNRIGAAAKRVVAVTTRGGGRT